MRREFVGTLPDALLFDFAAIAFGDVFFVIFENGDELSAAQEGGELLVFVGGDAFLEDLSTLR